jgi:hypothetical protein
VSRAKALRASGWPRAAVLDGGIAAWVEAGLPLTAPAYPPEPEPLNSKIKWSTDLEDARRVAIRRNKPLVVCYVAAWCDACRRFRKRTLASPEVNGFADRFEWALVDLDRDISVIRAENLMATPTTDLVDPAGVTRYRITGFVSWERLRKHLASFEHEIAAGTLGPDPGEPRPLQSEDPTELPQGYRGSAICFSNVGYGPLRLPSLSPFQSLRFGLVPRTPSTLAQGSFEFLATESWANLWARDGGEHVVDFEVLQSEVSLAYGFSDVITFELGFIQKSRFGGFMDGFIQSFHDLFGLNQGGRNEVSKDDFALEIDREDGSIAARLSNGDRGSFSESIVATFQHNLTCGDPTWPAVSYALSVRRELGEQEDMTGGRYADLSGSISLAKRWGDFYGYAGVGYSWFGREKFEEVELRTTQLSGLLALEWQVGDGVSLIVQYLVSQGVAIDLREFSRPSYELTFGGKFEIAPMTVLEIGLIENVITFDNSPDFGIHGGLRVRF